MRILIACEHSGVVRRAFRAKGHSAYSCDLLPSLDNSPFHLRCDVREVIDDGWDMFGFHPDCTFLSSSGIHWNNRGRGWDKTEQAVAFVNWCMDRKEPWYLENPIGILSSRICKPTQIIQPYEFGENASKRTCLWLNLLPILKPTKRISGRFVEYPRGSGKLVERWENQTDSGQNRLPPGPNRWKYRARTYQGIADAMAEQWGNC